MFVSQAYAQSAAAPSGGDFFIQLLPLILIFVVFYFLLIRPQQKKMREHREMVEAVKRNDKIITSGGIYGKVTKVEDTSVMVEIAQDVQVKVVKATISDVLDRSGGAEKKPAGKPAEAANDQKPAKSGLFGNLFKR